MIDTSIVRMVPSTLEVRASSEHLAYLFSE